MITTNSEIRSEARAALSGKWATSALFMFVFCLITVLFTIAFDFVASKASALINILLIPLGYGVTVGLLRQLRGEEMQLGWMFENFNRRVWVTLLLRYIYTVLWLLLLIVPGIIKSYSYALTEYILHDEAELTEKAAIERSMEIMHGRKMDMFLLDLSFLPWYLLSILTLGIGCLWVMPYHYTARASFYEHAKREFEETIEVID